MKRSCFPVVLFLGLTVLPASAQPAPPKEPSIAEKRLRSEAESKFTRQLEATNKSCETSLTGSIDWTNFSGGDSDVRLAGVLCADGLNAIKGTCGDQIGRDATKAKVKSYTCSFGAERSMALTEGKLEMKVDTKGKNYTSFATEWLKHNL